jgi:hypothetical protein
MNAARKQALHTYLGRTDWEAYRANGCLGVICGLVSYYFFFNDADQIVRVIID